MSDPWLAPAVLAAAFMCNKLLRCGKYFADIGVGVLPTCRIGASTLHMLRGEHSPLQQHACVQQVHALFDAFTSQS